MKSEFVNDNIGSEDQIEYIDIHGFDSTTGLPIVLYISKIVDIAGQLNQEYKIINGGITPINNDELSFKYISNNFTYIVDKFTHTINGWTGDYYDYIAVYNHI